MKNKLKKIIETNIFLWALKAPLILLLAASFIVSWYAAIKKIGGISYGTPIILSIILALYIIGDYLSYKKQRRTNN